MDATAPANPYEDTYRQYLQSHQALQPCEALVTQALQETQWEAPDTAQDYRNVAVVALVMAEDADDVQLRNLYLNMALEALQASSDPISAAHRGLLGVELREPKAAQQALSTLLTVAAMDADGAAPGIVYLPPTRPPTLRGDLLQQLLQAESAQQQALLLTVEILRRSPLVFYNNQGLRFLQLAVAHYPQVAQLQLQLGIAMLTHGRIEGMVNLHRAQALTPQNLRHSRAAVYQSLHLAYRPLSATQATYWQQQGLAVAQSDAQSDAQSGAQNDVQSNAAWQWTHRPPDAPITTVPFSGLTLAVEANLRSIVTSVLLAEGTWFEAELALWQQHLEPGMVVIDVGANVGVYTFSAAVQVGSEGQVFAVEPFEGCVRCLEETCRINGLDWVTVCGAAASDRSGTAQLALHGSSELNELVSEPPSGSSGGRATVVCMTLDSLVDDHGLERVDWIKIDAEGHELSVLKGAVSLLRRFKPRILYENVAAGQGANLEVSRWLQQAGYQLYHYQPFVAELAPVAALEETQRSLNLVAMPIL